MNSLWLRCQREVKRGASLGTFASHKWLDLYIPRNAKQLLVAWNLPYFCSPQRLPGASPVGKGETCLPTHWSSRCDNAGYRTIDTKSYCIYRQYQDFSPLNIWSTSKSSICISTLFINLYFSLMNLLSIKISDFAVTKDKMRKQCLSILIKCIFSISPQIEETHLHLWHTFDIPVSIYSWLRCIKCYQRSEFYVQYLQIN